MPMPAKYPQWAVNDIINPTSGQPNVVDPDTSDPTKKLLGWDFKEYPPRQWFNYLHRLVNDWIEYVNSDLFGNSLGFDVRNILASQISSHDAYSTDLDFLATDDIDMNAGDRIDITAINNLVVEGGDVWIDSAGWLYLIGGYEIDIDAGDYLLMTAGVEADITAPDISLIGVTDIKGMGGSAGLRLHTGKVMREYIEGGFTVISGGTYGNITLTSDWSWAWRRHDDIVDLTMGPFSFNMNSNGDGLYIGGGSFPIPDEVVYWTSGGYEQMWTGTEGVINDPSSVSHMTSIAMRFADKANWRIRFLDYTHPTGAAWLGQMHFRYMRDRIV